MYLLLLLRAGIRHLAVVSFCLTIYAIRARTSGGQKEMWLSNTNVGTDERDLEHVKQVIISVASRLK